MILKKITIILFLIFYILPINNIHAQTSSTGFIPASIWYSKDPFEEGDKIKIYTAIFNPDKMELLGDVVFFDQTTFLGKKNFSVQANGINDVSIDWTVTTGEHTIFGKIENAKFLLPDGKYKEVYLAENETEKSTRKVNTKIIVKTKDTNSTSNNIFTDNIQKIENAIIDNTPLAISQPIVATTNTLETLRQKELASSADKKIELKNDIKKLDSVKNTTDNKLLKPWKYIELFFFSIFSFILNNKIIFYGLLFIIIFFFIRYIWRLVF